MLDIGFALVTSLVLVLSLSGVFLCRNEIAQERRQASLTFKALSQHSEKGATSGRKLRKTIRAYVRERLKEQEHLISEISSLNRLLRENSIDQHIYARYRKLLEMGYEQKCQQTRERYGLIKNLSSAP